MAEETLQRTLPQVRAQRQPVARWGEWALRTNALFCYLFLYAPIVILVIFSFSNSSLSGVWGGFTLDWYVRLFNNDRLMEALWNSATVATLSMIIATIIGTMVAMGLERFRFRGRGTLDSLLYLPIVIPDIVMAVMLLLFFATAFQLLNGLFDTNWRLSLTTVIIAHVAFNISYVTVVVRASLRGFD